MQNGDISFSEDVQESLSLFLLEWYLDNTAPLVKHLNDAIFLLSVVESNLFSEKEVHDMCRVLKKLAIVLEGRVCVD